MDFSVLINIILHFKILGCIKIRSAYCQSQSRTTIYYNKQM